MNEKDQTMNMTTSSNAPKILKIGIHDVSCGRDVVIVEPANLYGCRLDDCVFIGPFVEIQSGVVVGPRTRIQSHSFICELVRIGMDCFVSHGVMFINDKFSSGGPARGNTAMWKGTEIGDRVSIGTNTTLLPVSICSDVVIGAGSVVTSNITVPGVYAGNPLKQLRKRFES
ncbi:MAG: acyltransferase [Cellvibrionaceae bacterium]